MKRHIMLIAVSMIISGYIFAKENLAILPFTGGQSDEGETIAELFSFNDRLNDIFSPIPRTSITQAINREQGFQMGSGMTDPDTIVSIGQQLGARYVVAGNITSIGSNKLLVIAIMDIRNLQQIAGDYQTYNNLTEIRGKLPGMADNIIQATQRNTSSLPKLAVVPVQLQGDVDQRVADTLTQILAIHLIKSGEYTVYPRTKNLEQVMNEHQTQFSGITADANVIGIGFGENPDLVLSVVARRLENINMFNAAIINLLTGTQVVGRSADYKDINDGMNAMETLSVYLTSTSAEIDKQEQNEEQRLLEAQRQQESIQQAAQKKAEREAFWKEKKLNATILTIGILSGYLQWGDGIFGGGGTIIPFYKLGGSPLPFTYLGLSGKFGGLQVDEKSEYTEIYGSGLITLGLVYPFTSGIILSSDFVLEMGYFGGLKGVFSEWATPSFAAGFIIPFSGNDSPGLEIKYQGAWYDGYYTHSVSLGLISVSWLHN